jgi:hypothetical protein
VIGQHFSTEALAEIQRMTAAQQGGPPADDINWPDILEELELAAHHYDLCRASARAGNRLTPQQTLNRLAKLDRNIADVLRELEDSHLIDWRFIRDDGTTFCASFSRSKHLIETIKTFVGSELQADIKSLEDFLRGRRARRRSLHDCEGFFLALLLQTGKKLFGQEIGDEHGPLIKFIRFAAGKVLETVPQPAALRSRLRRLEELL